MDQLDTLGADLYRAQSAPLLVRDRAEEWITPSLDDMAANPGGAQTLYRVTYQRVGRRGGRDGSQPPAPLTTWAVSPDHLAELIAKDVSPYLLSDDIDITVDLDAGRGRILVGFNNGGSFTIEALTTAAGGDR
ncbi:hypothetical protein ACFZDG_18310 [Kitasatospora xanthocidica]|uniref:hypothetical protein n=1 Tax=Kitasatospora xanthocidica TaxID=83382 RepID=UPI0036F04978